MTAIHAASDADKVKLLLSHWRHGHYSPGTIAAGCKISRDRVVHAVLLNAAFDCLLGTKGELISVKLAGEGGAA